VVGVEVEVEVEVEVGVGVGVAVGVGVGVALRVGPVVTRPPARWYSVRMRSSSRVRFAFVGTLSILSLALPACGHTDEEMAEKQRQIDKLNGDLRDAQRRDADDLARYQDAQNQLNQLKAAAAPAAAPSMPACARDSDCKGDRVCERGSCTSPH